MQQQKAVIFDLDETLIRCAEIGFAFSPNSHDTMVLKLGFREVTVAVQFFYLQIFLNTLKCLLAKPDLYTVGFVTAGIYSKENILTLFSKQLGSHISEEDILFFNRFDMDNPDYIKWVDEKIVSRNEEYSRDFVRDQKAFQILWLLESNKRALSDFEKICLLDDQFEYYTSCIQYASEKFLSDEEKFVCIPVDVSNDDHFRMLCTQLNLDHEKMGLTNSKINCFKRSSSGEEPEFKLRRFSNVVAQQGHFGDLYCDEALPLLGPRI